MMKTAQYVYYTFMAVLVLVLLVSCGKPTGMSAPMPISPTPAATQTAMPISPTLTATTIPTPDTTAIAEATYQAALNIIATSGAKLTDTSQAGPPTATQRPTATSSRPPSATPAEEVSGVMVHEVLVHQADVRTGLDEVDQIIDVVLAGDRNAFRQKIKFTTTGCTHVMALGGPENCREGEAEGTLIEVLPFLGPGEGSQLRRDEIGNWQGLDIAGLYTVYRLSDEAYSTEDYPAGEYGIVFRSKDPNTLVTLQVENGAILRIDFTFGTPPELDFERNAEEIILAPPNVDKGCPGASPQRVMIDEQASVCTQSDDLIMRSGPGLDGKELRGIEPGTNFMIVDGPACANNWFWWKVELDSGLEGWVAEGGDNVDPYFICPLE
ncbi:MAG: SH3 domain-containing protein [Chloroflexota bacterium]|nr:MAG: SH3 domain-containing protein [Chloroflexota bacterium]